MQQEGSGAPQVMLKLALSSSFLVVESLSANLLLSGQLLYMIFNYQS